MPVELHYVDAATGIPAITLGVRPRFRFTLGEPHFHHCPRCFDHGECVLECECEYDLDERGIFGAHALCDECVWWVWSPPMQAFIDELGTGIMESLAEIPVVKTISSIAAGRRAGSLQVIFRNLKPWRWGFGRLPSGLFRWRFEFGPLEVRRWA